MALKRLIAILMCLLLFFSPLLTSAEELPSSETEQSEDTPLNPVEPESATNEATTTEETQQNSDDLTKDENLVKESIESDATAPQDESVQNENDQLQLQESAVQTNTVTFNSNNVFNNAEKVSVKLERYLFNKTEISLAIKGKYLINNSIEITEGNDYSIKVENGSYLSLYVNGNKVQTFQNSFLISPIQYGTNNYAIINGREYLGNIEFTVEDSKYIRPINTLPIEDYLKGVVPGEMPASWGAKALEALKAQAVAARTYVKTHAGSVINDTVSYQAYEGYKWHPYTNTAVDQTAGKVLRYNGGLISANYSSSNGGYTESNANYWGSDQLPYLIAKKDPYDPKNPWQIVLDKQQINTSQLDLSQPEQWWSSVKESQVDTAELKNIKNYLLRQTGASDIKIIGFPKVGFSDDFTRTATGESTGNRTKGTVHIEYFMKDSEGNYVRQLRGDIPEDFAKTISGKTRYETSVEISRTGWTGTSDTIVLGRGDVHVDAITGTVLAKKYNAPLLLTTSSAVPQEVLNRIKELKPKKIYLLGGEVAISKNTKTSLESLGYDVERIKGSNRYDTSVEIAKQIGDFTEVFITSGLDNSPDALSIASHAASKQMPIILSDKDTLSESTKRLLKDKKINKVTLIGGKGALTNNIENQLKELGIQNIERVSGETRYHTSIAIANKYSFDKSNIYFAQGNTFIDALPGAVLASKVNAPVILTDKNSLPGVTKEWIQSLGTSPKLVYLGGEGAISTSARNQIKGALFSDIKEFTLEVNDAKMSVIRSMMGGTKFKSYLVTNVDDTSTQFKINGLGYGHGVGMSQYGAKSMAEQGFKYDKILGFYYPGTSLTN